VRGPTDKQNGSEWFDRECKLAKSHAKHLLLKFKRKGTQECRQHYVAFRKQYKELLFVKKKKYLQEKVNFICNPKTDIKMFWKEIKKNCNDRRRGISENISNVQWFNHFKTLFALDQQFHTNPDIEDEMQATLHVEALDRTITINEVKEALHGLKNGKSAGLDGIRPEMLKTLNETAVVFLTEFFNYIFSHSVYPEDWAKAIIVPIFKKGDFDYVDNYRGVSLLSVVSKCYTAILNKRLYTWLETNGKISETQAGFRKAHSTVDHIFTLNAVVQKCLSKNGGKCYVAFVDFKKAFDSVQHEKMIEALHTARVSSKFIGALKAMYSSMFSCVRNNSELTNFFGCPVGVRQGCVLSPTLFSVFINEIAVCMETTGKHGIQLLPGLIELYILLFADDLALLSFSPAGLRHQLKCLEICCNKMHLIVNIDKTKVMVFRRGGFLGANEFWTFKGEALEVVNSYRYLGYTFTTMLSVNIGTRSFALKGREAAYSVLRMLRTFRDINRKIFFKIFDSKISSILLYASELWGTSQIEDIERVHLVACKRFLGLPRATPNNIVYSELGRYPLYINSNLRCIKYWAKLLRMEENRLPRQAYRMLVLLDEKGKKCWASNIRELLFRSGFGIVWLHQDVGDLTAFLRIFRERLKDMFTQNWQAALNDSDRYDSYRSFKSLFETEKYIDYFSVFIFRSAITKFRAGMFPINANLFRFDSILNRKKCPFCPAMIENEFHILFVCPVYQSIRKKFIEPCIHKIRIMVQQPELWQDMNLVKTLAVFLVNILKIRSKQLTDVVNG